jgi:hypothetical protein
MNRKQIRPALPGTAPSSAPAAAESPMPLGFTAWVQLRSGSAVAVLAYRRALDEFLASRGLVRSMNPLHMLVWSPTRDVTPEDQVELLSGLALTTLSDQVQLSGLHTHVGLPSLRSREPLVHAQLSDVRCHAVFAAYRLYRHSAGWALDQFRQSGTFQA